MMGTGLLMWFIGLAFSRTSVVFVHDCLAWTIAIVLVGHMRKAYEDPETRPGMRTVVSWSWVARYHAHLRSGEGRNCRSGQEVTYPIGGVRICAAPNATECHRVPDADISPTDSFSGQGRDHLRGR